MTARTGQAEALSYYATPGPFTDLAGHAARLRQLPEALPELCRVVQGLIVHPFLAQLYGLQPQALRQEDLQIRSASAMLDRLLAVDPRELSHPRPPEGRFVGNCRHFMVLLCAFLRARGVSARARCGFGVYFQPSMFEDHVPRTQFLVAGDAWQRCRSGRADPERFGILDLRGMVFVLGNLIRDLAAHAKRELLPWDGWGFMVERDRQSDPTVLALLDRVAELTQAGDERHAEVLKLQGSEPGLRVPRAIVSFGPGGDAKIDLGPRRQPECASTTTPHGAAGPGSSLEVRGHPGAVP